MSTERTIQDFWNLDRSKMSKDELKNAVEEYYREDFINNYDKWSGNLAMVNRDLIDYMKTWVPEDAIEKMTYDHFCGSIINSIKDFIDLHGEINSANIENISSKMVADYMASLYESYSNKKYEIGSILESIKRSVAL